MWNVKREYIGWAVGFLIGAALVIAYHPVPLPICFALGVALPGCGYYLFK